MIARAWYWFLDTRVGHYLSNVGWGIDVFVNTLSGGQRETISARLGRSKLRGNKVAIAVCKAFDRADPNHCEESAKWWEEAHNEQAGGPKG